MAEILQAIAELLLQLVFEAIVRGLHWVARHGRTPTIRAIPSIILYGGIGVLCGTISLAVRSHHVIPSHTWRLIALLAVPVCNGFLMSVAGRLLEKRARQRSALDHFTPAFAFSLCFGAVRFFAAK